MRKKEIPSAGHTLSEHKIRARKRLGQNFLLDPAINDKIVHSAGLLEGHIIVEIGPGPGGLTRSLLEHGAKQVIALEKDARFLPALDEMADYFSGRLKIIHGDALQWDYREEVGVSPVKIIANLPYNVGTKIVIRLLSEHPWPPLWRSIHVLLQREVADRLVAPAGTSSYGRLSVLCQWRAHARRLFDISAGAFVPAPKVRSSLVELTPRMQPLPTCLKGLEKVTGMVFGQRRKMLRTSLRAYYPNCEALIGEAGLDPKMRPEQLSIEQFVALANILHSSKDET